MMKEWIQCLLMSWKYFLDSKQKWKDMSQAFKDNDIIPDNHNTCFREPRNVKERENGYY
ncbi:hypothetical protein [Clostridium perfringens]|uniref:hypothetical protein n=1 Tax=Clostridium perfringens TaxID=1502 RepID=UPI00158D9E38|nr:hypothetical protein [Clostridium perfringens]